MTVIPPDRPSTIPATSQPVAYCDPMTQDLGVATAHDDTLDLPTELEACAQVLAEANDEAMVAEVVTRLHHVIHLLGRGRDAPVSDADSYVTEDHGPAFEFQEDPFLDQQ